MPLISCFLVGFVTSIVTTLALCQFTGTLHTPAWLLNRVLRSESAVAGSHCFRVAPELFECKSSEETSELVSQVLIAAIFEKPTVFFQTISTVVRAGELGRSLVK